MLKRCKKNALSYPLLSNRKEAIPQMACELPQAWVPVEV